MSLEEARRRLYNGNYFGSCMVARGEAEPIAVQILDQAPGFAQRAAQRLRVVGVRNSSLGVFKDGVADLNAVGDGENTRLLNLAAVGAQGHGNNHVGVPPEGL